MARSTMLAALLPVVMWSSIDAHVQPAEPARGFDAELAAPPGAPQNLTATVSGTAVTLNWMPPETGAVSGYLLEA